MKNISIAVLFSLFLMTAHVNAQDGILEPQPIDRTSFGIGGGLDYGGFGGNLLIYPHRNIGIFGGVGYALAGLGYNVGAKFRIVSVKHRSDPYALAMYGYNAAIAVKGASQYNKLFYGPTIGMGLDLHSKQAKSGYWSLALLFPIRSSELDLYIDDLKSNHGVEFKNGLMPITVSVGYRFSSMKY